MGAVEWRTGLGWGGEGPRVWRVQAGRCVGWGFCVCVSSVFCCSAIWVGMGGLTCSGYPKKNAPKF